jgi:hypothetical protein
VNDDPFERAVARAEHERLSRRRERSARGNLLGFRIHLVVYVVSQLAIFAVWAIAGDSDPWFVYPLLGWGIGLAAHYMAVRDTWRNHDPGSA